jgi:alpha-L-fucosidase 2
LQSAAQFYLDFLIPEPTHNWLVVSPSMSPENAPGIARGKSIAAGVTMDNQLLFELFSNVIRASEILGIDAAFAAQVKATRDRLPPMQVGQHGQLQEWLQDIDNPKDKHRHVSHLFGLYPGGQISPYRTPELLMAARTTLIQRGDISTGWSMGWKVNLWARLMDGNHAYQLIRNQLTPAGLNKGENSGGGTYTNLFDAHPPFQIDGNFGCTAGIAEMMLQCYDGDIHLLPALPDAWKNGAIKGLRALGGFEIVEMKWQSGVVKKLVIRSLLGGNCRLRVPNVLTATGKVSLKPASGKNTNVFYAVDATSAPLIHTATSEKPSVPAGILYDLPTSAGQTYTLIGK